MIIIFFKNIGFQARSGNVIKTAASPNNQLNGILEIEIYLTEGATVELTVDYGYTYKYWVWNPFPSKRVGSGRDKFNDNEVQRNFTYCYKR